MKTKNRVDAITVLRRIAPHALAVAAMLIFALAGARAEWPEFRGPRGDGHVQSPGDNKPLGLPTAWSDAKNVKWKTAIPLRGWSTPVVLGGQVWVTTADLAGHDFYAVCIDAESGKIKFNEKLFHCDNPEPLGNPENCYASPSCAIEPGRVYVSFGSYGTACLDTATGKTIWKRDDLPCRHYRGPGSSLVIFEDKLIVTMDGVDVQYLVALDKLTGKNVWKTDRTTNFNDLDSQGKPLREGDFRKAYTTPLFATVGGAPIMFSPGARSAYAYDPRDGKELWKVTYKGYSNVGRPLFWNGMAIIHAGMGVHELWAIRPDGRGDVTETHIAWKARVATARTPSAILVDGLIYQVAEDGMVVCIDAANGKEVWKERIGGTYVASPIYGDGKLYFCNKQGQTVVLKPGRTCEVIARNQLGDGKDGFWASPAADGKALYLRTRDYLYRVEE